MTRQTVAGLTPEQKRANIEAVLKIAEGLFEKDLAKVRARGDIAGSIALADRQQRILAQLRRPKS